MATATLNDVNFEEIKGLLHSIKEDPTNADTRWQSAVSWKGGMQVEAVSRDLPPTRYDEPPKLGGINTAPNPVEVLLGTFGACLVIGYLVNCTAAGIRVDDLKVDVGGAVDLHTFVGFRPEGNAGYSEITAKVNIKSDATREQLEEIHRKTVATSPIGHTIGRHVKMNVELV